MKVLALIFDGFEEEEAMAPFALLRRAGAIVDVCSNKTSVTGSHGFTLANINLIDGIDYKDYDCLLIPGGAHYQFLKKSEYVSEVITYFMENNRLTCAICAAPTIIGGLGFLRGRNYTCFTAMNDDFGGTYHDDGVVVDGNLITGRSVAYSIDFAYAIIQKLLGDEVLASVHKRIYYEK